MKVLGAILASILVVVVLIGLSFGAETLSIKWNSHFNPQHENVKREVFEASRSFNAGKQNEIAKYMYTFNSTTNVANKKAAAQMVRMSVGSMDTTGLPYEMQVFIDTCKTY